MTGKEYIEKMRRSTLYKRLEEIESHFIKEDGTYDWAKLMKMRIVITPEDIKEHKDG